MDNTIIIVISNAALFHFYKSDLELSAADTISYYLDIPKSNVYNFPTLSDIPPNLKSVTEKKIVMTSWEWTPSEFSDLSWANLVININQEVIDLAESDYTAMIQKYYNTDKFLAIASALNLRNTYSDKFYSFPVFLDIVKIHNSNLILSQSSAKPFLFDALLGLKKPHRDFVFYNLIKRGLANSTLLSYINKALHFNDTPNPESIWVSSCLSVKSPIIKQFKTNGYYYSDELSAYDLTDAISQRNENDNIFNSYIANSIDHHGLNVPLARRVPVNIYNHSWYSIVTETAYERHLFITEKTAKPIIAKRLFVMFSTCGMLAELQRLGFKTFNSVIDESYDSEPDDYTRFTMAFNQIIRLATLDPNLIYNQISSILEHNYTLITSNKFTIDLSIELQAAIKKAH